MFQNMTPSNSTTADILKNTGPSTMGNRQVDDFEIILPQSPHPRQYYTHFDASMIPLPSPVPSQQIDIDMNSNTTYTNTPIQEKFNTTYTTTPIQEKFKPTIIQKKNKIKSIEEKKGVTNKKHIPDSTKSLGRIVKVRHKTPDKIITPSPKAYSRQIAKDSKKSSVSKASQTTLSLPTQHGSLESIRYTAMHMALLKLESMPKPEKKTTNSPAYVIRNQKERQMTLQNLNIDWSGLNKTEALRQYNVNCTKQHTITEESNDSI